MTAPNGVIWCRMPTATVGLVVTGGRVTEVAPYARRLGLLGRDARGVWVALAARGYQLVWLPDRGRAQPCPHRGCQRLTVALAIATPGHE